MELEQATGPNAGGKENNLFKWPVPRMTPGRCRVPFTNKIYNSDDDYQLFMVCLTTLSVADSIQRRRIG
jgi:hypothetical protein